MRKIEEHYCYGGWQQVWEHDSQLLGVPMRFGIFVPPQPGPRPLLTYLSGLTCSEQNVISKAGAQQYCAEYGIAFLCPDTSPRGETVPDAEGWDLGIGAGFYVDATEPPWSVHYRMYSYVVDELPTLVRAQFAVGDRESIMGHSMGGHGALICALKNRRRYCSVSAIAPICNPTQVPWGQKAFSAYLGDDRTAWSTWDACELLSTLKDPLPPILVDQGLADQFLETQLRPAALQAACETAKQPLTLRQHKDYDHSYYFIATVMRDHVQHHANFLIPGTSRMPIDE